MPGVPDAYGRVRSVGVGLLEMRAERGAASRRPTAAALQQEA